MRLSMRPRYGARCMATSDALEPLFRALADGTRRRVLERLASGPASVSELAAPFDMSLPAFTQHLGVLEDCGLVHSKKIGRVRTYRLAPRRMRLVEGWLARQRRRWEGRSDAHLDRSKGDKRI